MQSYHFDVYTQDAGESAIHAATVKGHVDVVRVLAHYGADLNMPNKVILHMVIIISYA